MIDRRRGMLLVAWLGLFAVDSVSAQRVADAPHTVRLAPAGGSGDAATWFPDAIETVSGTIVQFDADQIAIRLADQELATRFASDRVIEVLVNAAAEDQVAAMEQFKQGAFDAALPALIRSISEPDAETRPPVWRQQWLSMLAAQAAMRSGRGEIAIELIGQLDERPLPLIVLALLPLDWKGTAGEPLQQAAVAGARSPSPAVKLVAASWLLRSTKYRAAAETAIERLATQTERPQLARLAQQLRLRTLSPPEVKANVDRWERQLQALPIVLQTAPMVSLANTCRQLGLAERTRKWDLIIRHASPTWHPDL